MVQPVCFAGFVWRILFPQRVGREVATLVGCHLGLYTSFRFLYQVSRTALMLVSHRCISTLLAGFFVGKLRCSDAREAGWLVACSALSFFFFFSLWLLGCYRKRASQIKLGEKKNTGVCRQRLALSLLGIRNSTGRLSAPGLFTDMGRCSGPPVNVFRDSAW